MCCGVGMLAFIVRQADECDTVAGYGSYQSTGSYHNCTCSTSAALHLTWHCHHMATIKSAIKVTIIYVFCSAFICCHPSPCQSTVAVFHTQSGKSGCGRCGGHQTNIIVTSNTNVTRCRESGTAKEVGMFLIGRV